MKKLVLAALLLALTLTFATGCKKEEKSNLPPIVTGLETLAADGIDMLKRENKGKIIVINFFASWCPPCRIETPDFVKVYEAYKDKNFTIVGISIDDNKKDAVDFVNKYRMTFPVYMADKSLQAKYNVSKVPTSLIYRGDGELVHIAEGMLNEAYLKQLAESAIVK